MLFNVQRSNIIPMSKQGKEHNPPLIERNQALSVRPSASTGWVERQRDRDQPRGRAASKGSPEISEGS